MFFGYRPELTETSRVAAVTRARELSVTSGVTRPVVLTRSRVAYVIRELYNKKELILKKYKICLKSAQK